MKRPSTERRTRSRTTADTPAPAGYLHGYHAPEQDRLYKQAAFLVPQIFQAIDLRPSNRILEVGCGVGAMTEHLLLRAPQAHVTGIDLAEAQIQRARRHLANHPDFQGRYRFLKADAARLRLKPTPGTDSRFDTAFFCWVLEHVPNPVRILQETRRFLVPGGRVLLTEVQNSSLHLSPMPESLATYWQHYNTHQQSLGGDPHVGSHLASYLHHAGFTRIQAWPHLLLADDRDPGGRTQLLDYWTELLLSGAPSMLTAGVVTSNLVRRLETDLARLRANPDTTFFYTFMQASAVAP